MKIFANVLPRTFLAALLPAAVAFSSCGNDDDNKPTPAPDQGNVLISHAAASANVQVTALADDKQVGQLNYGQSSGYLKVNAGSSVNFKINNSAGQTAATQVIPVVKDQNYSVFAYAPTATTVGLLPVADDLTAPAAGQAKVRVVHLALGAPTPVKLSQQTVAGATDVPGVSAAFGGFSSFVSIPANTYNLLITTGTSSTTVVAVGDGTGTGTATATKNYESGKIYTIVVRGIASSIDPALQPRAVVIQNN